MLARSTSHMAAEKFSTCKQSQKVSDVRTPCDVIVLLCVQSVFVYTCR